MKKDGLSYRMQIKETYGRLQEKTLRNVMIKHLIENYGYESKLRIAETMVDDLLDLADEFIPKEKRLKPGQIMWSAVSVDDKHTQGKKLRQTKLVPVKLTVINEQDIEDYKEIKPLKEIRKKRIARLLYEARSQGGVLAQNDLAAIMSLNIATVAEAIKEVQQEGNKLLPTRGSVHDLGPTTTHKKQIIELYEQGYLEPEIAKKTNHALLNVDAYIKDYKRVKILYEENIKDADKIAFYIGMPKHLITQYLNIIENK